MTPKRKTPTALHSLKFHWAIVFGAFSVFFIVVTFLLLTNQEDGEQDYYGAIDSPASERVQEEFWPEHSILSPAELNRIELFLELGKNESELSEDVRQASPRLSELPFKLLIVNPNEDLFTASAEFLNQRSMKQERFYVGEELEPGVTLIYVSSKKAFVRNGPWIEYLKID